MFARVLVGVDGSAGGRDALAAAERMRRLGGGTLAAVHVHPPRPIPDRGLRPDSEAGDRRDAEERLIAELAAAHVTARAWVTMDPSPGRGIHRVADEVHPDLIVVGSSSRGPVGRVLAGDTGRDVLHGAPAAVMVAPREARRPSPRPVVGVGWDASAESDSALRWAAGFAAECGGVVRARHVVSPHAAPFDLRASHRIGQTGEAGREQTRERLRVTLGRLDVEHTDETIIGDPAIELLRLANVVDLVFVGSRGHGPRRRVVLGSTGDRLIHDAAAAVVIVPRPGAAR